MSVQHHNQPVLDAEVSRSNATIGGDARLPSSFVHELSNLLDGGLRNVQLVVADFQAAIGDGQATVDLPDHLGRLQVASQAMRQMVVLIRRQMGRSNLSTEHSKTLGQAVGDVVRLFAPAAAEHQIIVRVAVGDDAAALPAGPVHTIISNALRNSIQAITGHTVDQSLSLTSDDRRIEITACRTDTHVQLTVRDTGPGFSASLFDDDGRFSFGQTTKIDGHGIGLALISDTVHSLGGTVQLENNSPHGAVLIVDYPINAQSSPLAASRSSRARTE